ncbi:MAG: hypothetical protein EBT12_00345 [Marivivens sp.]|nr:hypothetical protein [Marivivens sp.]
MDYAGVAMTNFDHSIDHEVLATLRERPNGAYAGYPGWHFFGRVWFDGELLACEVWVHGVVADVVRAETPEDLMSDVCCEYGNE